MRTHQFWRRACCSPLRLLSASLPGGRVSSREPREHCFDAVAEGSVDVVPSTSVEQVLCAVVLDLGVQTLVNGPFLKHVFSLAADGIHALLLDSLNGDVRRVSERVEECS